MAIEEATRQGKNLRITALTSMMYIFWDRESLEIQSIKTNKSA
jgi:hypothetical protein